MTTRFQRLFIAAFALGCAFTTTAHAQVFTTATHTQARKVTVPTTPDLITPPEGNSAFMVGHADGTQGYICLPTSVGASTAAWTKSGRPQATLFQSFFGQDFQVITHFFSPDTNSNGVADPLPFGSPTWQSSLDSSKVWAQVFHGNAIVPAGSDPISCPNTGSIACLLLESIGSLEGPTGGTILSKTSFVQRLNTKGGSAPETGCFTSADVGNQALVPYTADYYFYTKDK